MNQKSLEYKIEKREFPENGHNLYTREISILKDLVGDYLNRVIIKRDDGYYYVYHKGHYNRFDRFNNLKDYIQFSYFINEDLAIKFIELLKLTDLDPSFDANYSIRWASENGHVEIVKLLLEDPRVDPSVDNNYPIGLASYNGHKGVVKLLLRDPRVDPSDFDNYAIDVASQRKNKEIVKILLKDPRVREKLTQNEIELFNDE